MLGHSVSYYLPQTWSQTPLYAEKIIPLLDHMLSVGSPEADKLALAYYDIINKYTNPEDMTEESIKEYIKDHGYGYILDLLQLTDDNLTSLLFLLPLIHILKSTQKGLEVVLSLLQASNKSSVMKITPWYQADPIAEEDTFTIETDINLSTINSSFFDKFDIFIRKYVFPTLTGMSVSYAVSGGRTLLPVVQTILTVDLKSTEMFIR